MAVDPNRISPGMKIYSADGNKLGKVHATGPTWFTIEKGFFFPKAYLASYAEVARVDDNRDAHLACNEKEFLGGRHLKTQREPVAGPSPPAPPEGSVEDEPRRETQPPAPMLYEEVEVIEFTGPSPRSDQAFAMRDRELEADEARARELSSSDSEGPYQT